MSDDMVNVLDAIRAGGKPECGWCKLYAPSGAYVTLPVTAEPLDYAAMLANVDGMLAAGFAVLAPGLEEGEQKEVIGLIARRPKTNKDGSKSAILDLYADNEAMKHKFIVTYIDNEDDRLAFEYATGLELEHMPTLISQSAVERGKMPETDAFIIRLPHPVGIVWKHNPKYSATEAAAAKAANKTYMVATKLFVRWEKERAAGSASSAPSKDLTPVQAESLWKEAKSFLASDPALGYFNDWIKQYQPSGPKPVVERFWQGIRAHAKAAGFVWDERGAVYVQPQQGDF